VFLIKLEDKLLQPLFLLQALFMQYGLLILQLLNLLFQLLLSVIW